MQIILNFNTRTHNDKLFINPDEWRISPNIDNDYRFFIDLNQFLPFREWVEDKNKDTVDYTDFVNDYLFYNEGDSWGCNYPQYEVIETNGKEAVLQPFDFVKEEKPKIDRRHKIEKIVKENVRLETELKGIRKAVKKIIEVLSLSSDPDCSNFLKNDEHIRKIIDENPKPPGE